MNDAGEMPPTAIMLMKMALGVIDAAGGRSTPVARHFNAAIEIAMGNFGQPSFGDTAAAREAERTRPAH